MSARTEQRWYQRQCTYGRLIPSARRVGFATPREFLGSRGEGGFPRTVGELLGSVGKCVSLGGSVSTQEQLYIALIESGRHRPNQTPLLPCMSTSTPTSTPVNRRSQYAIDSWSEREGGCGHGVDRDGCVIISGFLSGSRTQ